MAPDTGNMEILATFGSDKHRERFLLPLLQGTAKSCFGMTEPGVASSDPTQLQSTAVKDAQGQWIVNGRKWWTTGACDPRVMVCIFVARTSNDTSLPSHRCHSFFVVPMEEKGVTVVRPLTVLGYDDAPSGHAETSFENVSLSPDLLLGDEGKGFALAQSR
jgi:acyl-CoA dehydrogenase